MLPRLGGQAGRLAVQVVGQAQHDEVDLGEVEQGAVIGEVAGDAPLAGEPLGAARGGRGDGDDLGPATRRKASWWMDVMNPEPIRPTRTVSCIGARRSFEGRRLPAVSPGSRLTGGQRIHATPTSGGEAGVAGTSIFPRIPPGIKRADRAKAIAGPLLCGAPDHLLRPIRRQRAGRPIAVQDRDLINRGTGR